jgi:hypothetical protein
VNYCPIYKRVEGIQNGRRTCTTRKPSRIIAKERSRGTIRRGETPHGGDTIGWGASERRALFLVNSA